MPPGGTGGRVSALPFVFYKELSNGVGYTGRNIFNENYYKRDVEIMEGTVVITSGRMAGWLQLNGMALLSVKTDLKDPNRYIFIFSDTPLLRKYMSCYPEAKAKAYLRREELVV